MAKDAKIFAEIVDTVSRELVTAEHRSGASFIRTPLLYPSGSTVVVRIEDAQGEFFVSDMGLGFQEADMMGGGRIYARHAKLIADVNGVGFDSHSFFVIRASRGQLAGAAIAVANCSLQAANRVAERLSREKESDAAEELFERLVNIFKPENVEKRAEFYGASTTPWEVTALVRSSRSATPTIFEPVANHRTSIAAVATKFGDLSRLDTPPHLVSVVHDKTAFGTLLGVLSQTGHVINDNVPDKTFLRLAEAA